MISFLLIFRYKLLIAFSYILEECVGPTSGHLSNIGISQHERMENLTFRRGKSNKQTVIKYWQLLALLQCWKSPNILIQSDQDIQDVHVYLLHKNYITFNGILGKQMYSLVTNNKKTKEIKYFLGISTK